MYSDFMRKKMSTNKKFKTIEGSLPLTLEKSLGKPLKDYKIYGNTITGKNLFNIDIVSSFTKQSEGTYKSNTSIRTDTSLIRFPDDIGQITISGYIKCEPGMNYRFAIYYTDGTKSEKYMLSDGTFLYNTTFSSPQKTINYIGFGYASTSSNVELKDVQIELGANATPYEPYSNTITGKNLFNVFNCKGSDRCILNLDGTLSVTNAIGDSSSISNTTLIEFCPSLKVGDIVTLSGVNEYSNARRIYLNTSKSFWDFNTNRIITQDDLNSSIRFYATGSSAKVEGQEVTAIISNIQIEYGEIATKYEPYAYKAITRCKSIQSVGDKTNNLLPFPYKEMSKTQNGVNWEVAQDQTITASGVATGYSGLGLVPKSPLEIFGGMGTKYINVFGTFNNATLEFSFYSGEKGETLEGTKEINPNTTNVIDFSQYPNSTFFNLNVKRISNNTINVNAKLMIIDSESGENLIDVQTDAKNLTRCTAENINNGIKLISTGENNTCVAEYTLNNLMSGKRYIISFDTNRSGDNGGGIRVITNGATSINYISLATGSYYYNFIAGDSNAIRFYVSVDPCTVGQYAEFTNVRLIEVGYEPYGYKLPIISKGSNLFPIIRSSYSQTLVDVDIIQNDYTYTFSGTASGGGGRTGTIFRNNYVTLPAGTYTACWNTNIKINSLYISNRDTNDVIQSFNFRNNGNYISFTLSESTTISLGINFTKDYVYDNKYIKMWIVEGTEYKSFQPYQEPVTTNIHLNEPLRKIGEYTDYIHHKSNKLTTYIKEVDLGSLTWTKTTNTLGAICYTANLSDSAKGINQTVPDIWCQKYLLLKSLGINSYKTSDIGISLVQNTTNLAIISDELYDNVNSFKQAHSGIMLYYRLEYPVEEEFISPKIPTTKGTCTLDVNTSKSESDLITQNNLNLVTEDNYNLVLENSIKSQVKPSKISVTYIRR